jgi:uncharacterized protein with LGFP repeats
MATSLKQSSTQNLINPPVFGNGSITIDPNREIPHLAITDAKRLIKQKYDRVSNLVGKAVSDVQGVNNSLAYFQNFSNGCIVATTLNANNVFEIHGAIYAKWNEMGRAAYGLPLTDEMTTPDGKGRYNHFTGGKSIYWHPATGAHAIYGSIRTLWSENGWETSALGYPVSDELAAGDAVGRISNFQHGAIYWSPLTGAYILPESLTWTDTIVTGGLAALGGNYELTFFRNGNFIFRGHMHDSGADNYDSQLAVAILDTLGTAYTFEHKGHTSGTFSSGSRNDDWVNAGFNENIANHWGQMKFAAYSRVFNYDSEVASAIQDAVADALKKLVQAGIQAGVNAVIALITA